MEFELYYFKNLALPGGLRATMIKEITNYDGGLRTSPDTIIFPETVAEIQAVVRDHERFRGPVRPIGSFYSLTPCGAADGGTTLRMSRMARILNIDTNRMEITAETGLTFLEAARVLRQQQLQFITNLEPGNVTLGSAACCHTRDALDGIEFGQASSYVTKMKWVTPSGDLAEASEDTELLRRMRSSYGLCGVVYEVRFRIKPLEAIHLNYTPRAVNELSHAELEQFFASEGLRCWTIDHTAIFQQRQTVKEPFQMGAVFDAARRRVWNRMESAVRHKIEPEDSTNGLVYSLLQASGGITLWNPEKMIESPKYSYSCWAFPKENWLDDFGAYLDFADAYHKRTGFRANMPTGSSLIRKDANALLSYSQDGDVMTLEPTHSVTDFAAWQEFLKAFNEFAFERKGVPLLNQTPLIERRHVEQAYGERWREFSQWTRKCDPQQRMLNPFFADLISARARVASAPHAS